MRRPAAIGMTGGAPLLQIRGLVKQYGGLRPLRVAELDIDAGDRVVLSGLDRQSAEMFMHLVTGAALPDEGGVRIAGTDTRDISTDTDWLLSLDRFGMVTHRSVLLDSLTVAANLALPITLSIDPMDPGVRTQVGALASLVGLPQTTLDAPVSTLDSLARVRLHLARALAATPQIVLLEHPTAELKDDDERRTFGETLKAAAESRQLGWLAISEDTTFARASGGSVRRLLPANGVVTRERSWWPWK